MIYVSAPLAALLVSSVKTPRQLLFGKIDFKEIKVLVSYSFWFMVSRVSLMVFMNFDVLYLAAFAKPEEVGYFGSGFKIASVLYLVVNALTTVLMPQVGKKLTTSELNRFLVKTVYSCAIIAICLSPVAILGARIIPILAGSEYLPAMPVFSLVAWDHIAMILFTPFMLALFAINRPKLFACFSLIEMSLNIIGDIVFVPFFGAVGAAGVTLVVRIVNGTIGSAYMIYKFRKDPGFVKKIL